MQVIVKNFSEIFGWINRRRSFVLTLANAYKQYWQIEKCFCKFEMREVKRSGRIDGWIEMNCCLRGEGVKVKVIVIVLLSTEVFINFGNSGF